MINYNRKHLFLDFLPYFHKLHFIPPDGISVNLSCQYFNLSLTVSDSLYFIMIMWTNGTLIKSLKIIRIFVNTFISVIILIFKTKVQVYNIDNLVLET